MISSRIFRILVTIAEPSISACHNLKLPVKYYLRLAEKEIGSAFLIHMFNALFKPYLKKYRKSCEKVYCCVFFVTALVIAWQRHTY